MEKEHALTTLAQVLNNNMGNRITGELANGIIFSLGQEFDAAAQQQKPKKPRKPCTPESSPQKP